MEKDLLEIGETIKYKEPKGYVIYEFTRLGLGEEDYLSDDVEYKRYDSRKKDKGKGAWILLKDMPSWIKMLEERGFEKI